MRTCRTFLGLLLVAPFALAGEVVPTQGEAVKGDIVKLTATDVVYKVGDKEHTKAIKDVLRLELREVSRPASATFARVELTDGSILLAKSWAWKKKDLELDLLSGAKLTLPVAQVANILNTGHNKAHELNWLRERLPKNRGKNVIVRLDRDEKGKPHPDRATNFETTFGEGDATGTKITFVVTDLDDNPRTITSTLVAARGFIFRHVLPPRAPATALKLIDTSDSRVMVASLTPSDKGVTVTTPAGVKIDYTYSQVATLDYAKGRFEFLVDLDESKQTIKDGARLSDGHDSKAYKAQEVTVGGVTTRRGQVFLANVEVTFELDGGYQRFQAFVGENTRPGGDAKNTALQHTATLVVEGDGRELATVTISGKDKVKHRELTLNVKDVQKLKFTYKRKDLETGGLAMAEARVIK